MAPRAHAPRPLTTALTTVLLLVVIVAPAAVAGPGQRAYSADVLPTCVPADTSVTFTTTIRNETASDTLGSAKIDPPAGFVITAIVTPPPNGTVTFDAATIRMGGIAVPPGGSTSVSFQATTAGEGEYVWHVGAKKSNDPDGPPDNLVFRGGGSHVETLVDRCVLRFDVQPADAEAGANVTGADLDPDGPPVAVEVLDGPDGDLVTTSSDTISLELLPPPDVSGAALSPTVPTATAAGGLAVFDASAGDGFSITPAGNGYELRAVARPGIAPTTSDPFNVIGTGVVCTGPGCTSTVVSSEGVTVTVTAPNAEAGDVISVLLDVEELSCPGYTPLAGTPIVTFTVTGDSHRVITIRIPAALATRPVNQHRICYGSALAFTDRFGAVTNVGLLPNCTDKQEADAPCQRVSRIDRPQGDHVVSFIAPPGSTRGRT